ncbi:1A family penicillin-binding protein [Lachnotalea glycerini]|uniref:Penicillin-binding protein 1A n=1 Tax=Lachnotalea glycerini TaxID=1763509 RepID=A0A318ET37_9FIRM|nr:PBP1A family penicillin-binding protein [Lachnotalea glycerini]PXV91737.1 1A family penicillin-binding protein [Lachnotalea glycerini]
MAKGKNKNKHRLWKVLCIINMIILVLAGITAVGLYATGVGPAIFKLHKEAISLVRSSSAETFKASQTSLVYASDGEEIASLKGDKGIYYIESERIPTYVKNAFISIEDKNFYSHNGIDIKAIIRAATSIIEKHAITQGASTITQQLSRNIFLSNQVSWERKVEEIFIALEMEKVYSKSDILEFYLNNIYFANGYYGIQAASMGYFSTDVNNLSLSQIAFLTAIPNNPTTYNPLEHMDNTLARRNRILDQMLKEGKISNEDYSDAVNEEIVLNVNKEETIKHNYAETYIYYCAIRALMEERGFQFQYYFDSQEEKQTYQDQYETLYAECQNSLYTSGYRIYTSMDMTLQEQLQTAIDDKLYAFVSVNDDGIYNMQGAATCIDNKTGNVVAIIGGRSQETVGYTLNRAYQSFRQPGSAIKPLLVYAPAFEKGYTPDSTMVDEPITDGPKNYSGTYTGVVSLRYAVMKSINTIAWQLLEEITPSVGLSYLKAMNFAKIEKDDYRTAIALGGFTTGVSSVEMAAAYATLENNGVYRYPTCITKIATADGEIIYQSKNEGKQIYKENAAKVMTDVLKSVMTDGTGRKLGISQTPTAGKTGTTNDNKDGWFVGFSAYYTTSVWVGCDMPKEVEDLTGTTYPGKIWQEFMENAHKGLEPMEFSPYVSYDSVEKYSTDTDHELTVTEDTTNAIKDTPVTTEDVQTQPPASYFEAQQ